MKFGSKPFSTFRSIIYLTTSNTLQSSSTKSAKAAKYSSSLLGCSRANRARLTVETLTEPTLSAVPPILLKYPKSSILLLRRQQLLKEFTLSSIKRLESLQIRLCSIPHCANSSSINLPFFRNKLIVNPICLYRFVIPIP